MMSKKLSIPSAIMFGLFGVNSQAAFDYDKHSHLSVPGDDKRGYESQDYETNAKAIEKRSGQSTNLLEFVEKPPLGLPPVPVPRSNPFTRAKVDLGRKLFFDRRLSFNDTFSCAMCHVPEQGFSSNEVQTAVGVEGRSGRRNSPTIYNIAYSTSLFHDGREENLEQQIWGPLLAHNEMGNASIGAVLSKIRQIPDYKGLFEAAFDGKGPSMNTVGMALAVYQRTLVSGNSPFDRWYYGKEEHAISADAKHGFQLFTGKARCATCHTIAADHALFTDNQLHNTGHGYRQSMGIKPKTTKVQVAPGIFREMSTSIIDKISEPVPADLGLYEVTQNPHDRWKYRTPSLRNITLSAPYFHDGAFQNLREVVEFYNEGGIPNVTLDPLIKPLNLNDKEMDDLVTFMRTLTGDNVNRIILDSFAAPIGDSGSNDPNWVRGTHVEVR